MKKIHIYKAFKLLVISSTLLLVGYDGFAHPFATDTLQREMVLQREFQPIGQQAEKAYFNPLQNEQSTSLRPINFARNTYPIAMNVVPKLFSPLEQPKAPQPVKQSVHARIYGGLPATLGANVGVLLKTSEVGSLLISADHQSRWVQHPKMLLPINPKDISHNSDVAVDYIHSLSNRVLSVGFDLYRYSQTYYGMLPLASVVTPPERAAFPLAAFGGAELTVNLSPAPTALVRGVVYSVNGKLSLAGKEDLSTQYKENNVIAISGVTPINRTVAGGTPSGRNRVRELSLDLDANIGYKFAGTDWGIGTDAHYNLIALNGTPLFAPLAFNPLKALSVTPYFDYTAPTLKIKAGAKLQLLNHNKTKLMVVPDLLLRIQASNLFSLYLNADGGAEYQTLRSLYQQNKWADAWSIFEGFDVAQYRVVAGVELGNINGFSLDLQGGYAFYNRFANWTEGYHATLLDNTTDASDPHTSAILTPIFSKVNAGKVANIFFGAKARYLSPIGLDLAAHIRFNSYKSKDTKQSVSSATAPQEMSNYTVGYGRPTLEIGLTADYSISDKLGINIHYSALGGIKYGELKGHATENSSAPETLLPEESRVIAELGASVSYKLHPNVGLSLIGENLLNQKNSRWRGYQRPGATALLAATFIF